MCKNNRERQPAQRKVINHGQYKRAGELASNEINRVSLPGDVDYRGVVLYD